MLPNIALLGSGTFAKESYLPAILALQGKTLNLHSIWSRSSASVESFNTSLQKSSSDNELKPNKQYGEDGLKTILENKDINGVLIVLPITSQPDLVLKCLQHGKHVLSEKPLAKDVNDAKELIENYEREYRSKGLIWRVAENYSHEPILREASEIISTTPELGPILFWQMNMQGYIEDGSKYHATGWRTIPDYQGGFLLDGGVHWTALLRTVLPPSARPSSILSVTSLHRTHLLPHDTIQAISLPSKSSHTPSHGGKTKLTTAEHSESNIPGGIGESYPTGQILISFASSNLPQEKSHINGLTITFLNGLMEISAGFNEEKKEKVWKIEITPGQGTELKGVKKEGKMDGVKVEIEMFTKAISKVSEGGKVNDDEDYGKPKDTIWDLAVLEAMLKNSGKEIKIDELLN